MKALFLFLFITLYSTALQAQKKASIITTEQSIQLQDATTLLRRNIFSLGIRKASDLKSGIETDVPGMQVVYIDRLIRDTVYGASIFYSLLGNDTINVEVIAVKHLPGEIPSFSGDRLIYLWGRTQRTISYSGRKNLPDGLPSADIVSEFEAIIQKLRG